MGVIWCSASAAMCSGRSRRARSPPWTTRVQRLDPAVEHFRESGHVAHVAHREAGVAQRAGRAAGGDEVPAEGGEALGELDQAGLIGNGEQGAHGIRDEERGAEERGNDERWAVGQETYVGGATASAATSRASERMSRRSTSSAGEWLYRSGHPIGISTAP